MRSKKRTTATTSKRSKRSLMIYPRNFPTYSDEAAQFPLHLCISHCNKINTALVLFVHCQCWLKKEEKKTSFSTNMIWMWFTLYDSLCYIEWLFEFVNPCSRSAYKITMSWSLLWCNFLWTKKIVANEKEVSNQKSRANTHQFKIRWDPYDVQRKSYVFLILSLSV